MLGLIGWEEIKQVLDLDDDQGDEDYIAGVIERATSLYQDRNTFFTPYEKSSEIAGDVLGLLWYPLAATLAFVVTAVTAAIAACYFVGCLLFTLGAVVVMSEEYRNIGLEAAINSLFLTGISLLGAATAVLAAAFCIPHTLVHMASRGVKTVIETAECCESNQFVVL